MLVVHNQTQQELVAKKINMHAMPLRDRQRSEQEAQVLQTLSHKNIVEFKESFVENGILIIVMEYCSQGDLSTLIKTYREANKKLDQATICTWFIQIASAVAYIHTRKIIHRDLKSSNVYIAKDGVVKLGDFGIVKLLECTNGNAETMLGTPYYMSPEICKNFPYSFKSDIWSLGVFLHELCTLEYPFKANNIYQLIINIIHHEPPDIGSEYSPALNEIIKRMLIKDVNRRPSLQSIMNDPFFKPYVDALTSGETPLEKLKRKKREADHQQAYTSDELTGKSVFLPYRYVAAAEAAEEPAFDLQTFMQTLLPPVVKTRIELSSKPELPEPTTLTTTDDLQYSMTLNEVSMPEPVTEEKSEKAQVVEQFKQEAIAELTEEIYNGVYILLKQMRSENETDDIIRDKIEETFGSDVADNFYLVDQVIYFESQAA